MKKEYYNALSIVSLVLLSGIIVTGVLVYVNLPTVVDLYIDHSNVEIAQRTYNIMLPVLYCVGVPIIGILAAAWLLMLNVAKGKPFVRANVIFLRVMSLLSLISGLIFILPIFLLTSIYPIILFVVFVLLAIIGLVFADLFRVAIKYREENELTI